MDTTALVATLTSALAIGLAIVLVRLMRQERQRSDARVAALVTLSGRAADAGQSFPPVRLERKSTTRALKGCATPITDALPASHPAHPVATVMAQAARPARAQLNVANIEIFRDAAPVMPMAGTPTSPELFGPAVRRSGNALLYVGAAALAMAGLIALSFGWALTSERAPADETTASMGAPRPAAASPLALLALRHEQGADGTLVISGVVRNPAEAIARQKLYAAASLVDASGALVASARAPLDYTMLGPGEESPFVVRVSGANGVARYRIGFRDAEGASVAHVDKRQD